MNKTILIILSIIIITGCKAEAEEQPQMIKAKEVYQEIQTGQVHDQTQDAPERLTYRQLMGVECKYGQQYMIIRYGSSISITQRMIFDSQYQTVKPATCIEK